MKLNINIDEKESLGTALGLSDKRKEELLAYLDKFIPQGKEHTLCERIALIADKAKTNEEYTFMIISDTRFLQQRRQLTGLRREWMDS